ncbi:MAG: hypothetical protein ACPGF7_15535, partial [Pontibacterium sp.]
EVTGDARFGDAYNDDAVELGWSAGGSVGFVQAYDRGASAFRDLQLNNAVTITSGGSVGIGTSSPTDRLVVQKDASSITPLLVLKNDNTTDDNGMSIDFSGKDTGANNITYGRIDLRIPNHATEKSDMRFYIRNDSGSFSETLRLTKDEDIETIQDARIMWRHQPGGTARASIEANSSDTIIFKTGSSLTERIRFQSGGGISFNGDTAAANALDDYEEGTFTYSGSSANLTSFSTNDRTYTKIGRQVTLWMRGSFSVTTADTRTFFSVTLPINAASNSTVIAGGGLAEGPSPFKGIALGVADASLSNATSAFCSFTPITTGSHNFWVTITYNAA